MEALGPNDYLIFKPNTLEEVRKIWGLDKPGDLDKIIDTFDAWIKKQEHFTNREFSRSYLEKLIIINKGSVEKAKICLDDILSARTLFPEFYGIFTAAELTSNTLVDVIMPRPTKDYYRIVLFEMTAGRIDRDEYIKYIRSIVYTLEYGTKYDYCNGCIFITDCRNANLVEVIKSLDYSLLSRVINLVLRRYGIRMIASHFISSSKLINTLSNGLKQIVSKKLASRIHVHENLESVYDSVDRDLLPCDYGEQWLGVLTSEDFLEYIGKNNEYKTNESLRPPSEKKDELDMQGSFRNLTVD